MYCNCKNSMMFDKLTYAFNKNKRTRNRHAS